MDPSTQIGLIMLALLGFCVVSSRLTRRWLTTPLAWAAFGLASGSAGLGWLDFDPNAELVRLLAEATLVLLLFSDASQIPLVTLRKWVELPARLLGVGLPLTMAAGTAVAWALFDWSLVESAMVATILAPTDAALGHAVVSNAAVPARIRQALTVEAGLNDGIVLPGMFVLLALATADVDPDTSWLRFWVAQVTLGPLAGLAIGASSGWLLAWSERREWSETSFVRIGSLCVAALCYLGAEEIGGNGFMAAWVGGLAFGTSAPQVSVHVHAFLEAEGKLLMLAVFLLVGCVFAGPALAGAEWNTYLFALLSLTVLRMVPVAISLVGSGTGLWSTVFLGWFGPRGLASLLFGLLIMEDQALESSRELFQVVVVTVLFSILLHGLTAGVGAERYGRWCSAREEQLPDRDLL